MQNNVLLLFLLLAVACQRVDHKADTLGQEAEALVQQAARIILDTDGCKPEEIADEIIISCL